MSKTGAWFPVEAWVLSEIIFKDLRVAIAARLFWVVLVAYCVAGLLAPGAARAQGEAATVAKMFNDCVASGGVAASSYNAWVAQNGCKCNGSSVGSGQVTCPKAAGTTTTGTASSNPMVTFVQTYQKAIEEARARDAAQRNAATEYNSQVAAGASQEAELKEDSAQTDDLAKYRVRKANEEILKQGAFANAHDSASQFLNQNALIATSDGARSNPAMQKAWKQLHCLAYVSRIAFQDLALNDYGDFHDLAPEAAKAFDGSAMGVSCPAAPMPDLGGRSSADLGKVSSTLKSDLDQATAVAQRMEPYKLDKTSLPPVPPDVAADPKLAAVWKLQKALNAVDAQPNPGKTPDEFLQVVKDRDVIKKSLLDSNNAANGDFGAIQVDLTPSGAVTVSGGAAPTQP